MKKKIVLTGGGTAGHIYPALALIPKLKDYEIHYFGGNGMEKEIYNNRKKRKLERISKFRLKSCEKYVKLCSFMEKSYQNSYIMLQYGESNEKGGVL